MQGKLDNSKGVYARSHVCTCLSWMLNFASTKFKTVGAFKIIIHQNLIHNMYVLAEYMKGIITISDTTYAIFKLGGKIHFHDQDAVRSS